MDMVQPPGMGMPPAIVRQEYHVIAAAPVNATDDTAYTTSSRRWAVAMGAEAECAAIASGSR